MQYLEITSVPVPRDTNPITAPAAELAFRLINRTDKVQLRQHLQETVELRFDRMNGKTHCYLGVPCGPLMLRQAESLLRSGGFLFRSVPCPPAAVTGTLLHRAMEQHPLIRPGLPPEHTVLPMQVTSDPRSADSMFRILSELSDGCGVVFFFRRAPALSLPLASSIHRLNPEEGSFFHELLHTPRLYEAVGCVHGSGTDLQLLTSEVLSSLPGLQMLKVSPVPVSSTLFDSLDSHITARPPVSGLCSTFLPRELRVLADITASAGRYGLPLNRDTIFGIPRPRETDPGPTLCLGSSADGESVTLPMKLLRQHLFMAGAPGSGKGNQLFRFAVQLHKAGVPLLLIESAKEEMHHLRKVIPELQVWRPREGEYILNPFSLEGDITCGEMRSSLLQALRLCFKLDGPLEELFSDTLNRCFAKNGFADHSTAGSPGVQPFGLSEFMEEYAKLLEEKGYSKRTGDDMKTAGMVRLNALFNQSRAVFDTVHSVPVPELLQGRNLLQLNCLPTAEAKQMFASLLLISISAWLRLRGTHCADRPVKLAIILDESHNLLQPITDSQGRTFSFARDFANMLLELRSQGVAILLADQSSSNIPREITDVCATKMFFGSSVSSGIDDNLRFLGTDETAMKHLYLLRPGEGIYVTAEMATGAFFACPNVIDKFHLEQPYPKRNRYLEQHPRLTLETFRECGMCPARGSCSQTDKSTARQIASALYQQHGHLLGNLTAREKTPERDRDISRILRSVLTYLYPYPESQRWCAVIQFVRDFNREHPGTLPMDQVLANGKKLWDSMKNQTTK